MFDVGWLVCSLAAFLMVLRQDHIDRIPNLAILCLTLGLFCKETAVVSSIIAIPLMWLHDPSCLTRIASWQWAKLSLPIAVYAPLRFALHGGSLSYAFSERNSILPPDEANPVGILGHLVESTLKAWDHHLLLPVNETLATRGFNVIALEVLLMAAFVSCVLPAVWKRTPPLKYWWVPGLCGFLTLLPALHLLSYVETTMLHSRWMYGTRAFFCIGLAGLWVFNSASRPGLVGLGIVWLLTLHANMDPYQAAREQLHSLSGALRPHLQEAGKDRVYLISDTLDHDRGALLLRNGFRDFLRRYGGPRWDGGIVGEADGSRASFSVEKLRRGEVDLPPTSLLFSWDGHHHLLTPLKGTVLGAFEEKKGRSLEPASIAWESVQCETRPAKNGALIITSKKPDPRILYELPGDGLYLRALRFKLQMRPDYLGGDCFFVTGGGDLIHRPFKIGKGHWVEVLLRDPFYPARDVIEPIHVIRIDPLGGPGEAILSELELFAAAEI